MANDTSLINFCSTLNHTCLDAIETCVLHFDRRKPNEAVPPSLYGYTEGVHSLHLKQVPSCMIIRRVGQRHTGVVSELLKEEGFSLDTFVNDGSSVDGSVSEDPNPDPEISLVRDDGYEDPWLVMAGWYYSSLYKETKPEIKVWAGGCTRITDRHSPKWYGSARTNTCYFADVRDPRELMYFLGNRTFWGRRLQIARRSGKKDRPLDPLKNFAETLWRRLSHLLRGRHDPIWGSSSVKEYWVDQEPRSTKARSLRLIEVLKTVDGLFLQRFMTFPEEQWSWEKFDLFVIQAIQILISDEFLDGEITERAMSLKSQYSRLKASRKLAKLVLHKDKPLEHLAVLEDCPRWVKSFLKPVWTRSARLDGLQRVFAAGILSQTRGCGTPPPVVILQSKEKFLKTVSTAPGSVTKTSMTLIMAALDELMGEIPSHIFTGLDTKARVTVTGSACWEHTRREGGTAEAILRIMARYDDEPIPIRDLVTGRLTGTKPKLKFPSLGTAVFWACLDSVLSTPLEELRRVFLTVVTEPGKGRSVSKGSASLKIVLDTVSKLCSYPLKKGMKTSESGMGKSNHGWNLFRDMFSDEMYDEIFKEESHEDDEFASYIERTIVWQDMFAGSTDFREATDKIVHSIASLIADRWMRKCGIPPFLMGIVHAVCYQPREVYFTAKGHLKTYGTPVNGDIRKVLLVRGVLMGDPLTKVVLHLINMITRRLGDNLLVPGHFLGVLNSEEMRDLLVRELAAPDSIPPTV